MATGTLGTTSSTGLTSLNPWNAMSAAADVATIQELILKQGGSYHPQYPGAFSNSGRLFLPGGRGIIALKPGDYIGVDNFGWPIVISGESITSGTSWSHNP